MSKKQFFMPGQELTEEEKVKLREMTAGKDKATSELLKKHAEENEAKKEVDFMNASFEAFEDRVLVYPDPVESVTKGGIYKPDEALNKIKPVIGTVVKVGPGKDSVNVNAIVKALGYAADNAAGLKKEKKAMHDDTPKWIGEDFEALLKTNSLQEKLKPGDRIVYGNYAGTEFVLNDIKYLIMRFADIFGRA